MSTPKFIVQHQDEQLGPFDERELKGLWAAGRVLGLDYVYDEAKQDWVLLAERFAWAAAGQLDDTVPVKIEPPAMTEEITIAPPVVAAPDVPPAAPPAPPARPGAEVRLVNGHGELSLADLKPGHFSFQIQHAALPTEDLHVDVRPAEPTRVRWTPPTHHVVGHELEVSFDVVDADDHPCVGFSGEFTVIVETSGAQKRHDVKTIDGAGVVRWTHVKAETWSIRIEARTESRGAGALVMPAAHQMEWTPGPAERLILDGPTEYRTGSPLKVQVKAVDAYGNVASDFQGTVVLDVKAG